MYHTSEHFNDNYHFQGLSQSKGVDKFLKVGGLKLVRADN